MLGVLGKQEAMLLGYQEVPLPELFAVQHVKLKPSVFVS